MFNDPPEGPREPIRVEHVCSNNTCIHCGAEKSNLGGRCGSCGG